MLVEISQTTSQSLAVWVVVHISDVSEELGSAVAVGEGGFVVGGIDGYGIGTAARPAAAAAATGSPLNSRPPASAASFHEQKRKQSHARPKGPIV